MTANELRARRLFFQLGSSSSAPSSSSPPLRPTFKSVLSQALKIRSQHRFGRIHQRAHLAQYSVVAYARSLVSQLLQLNALERLGDSFQASLAQYSRLWLELQRNIRSQQWPNRFREPTTASERMGARNVAVAFRLIRLV